MKELLKNLSAAKKEIGAISKDSKNPFFKSKYFNINQLLEHVEPVLLQNGLLLTQPIKENKVYSIIWDIESGEFMESYLELPNIADPQKILACITYFRRGTLTSILSIQAEDDDGNKAAKPAPKKVAPIKTALTEEGFLYLATKGTKADILKAKETRILTVEQLKSLDDLIKTKKV